MMEIKPCIHPCIQYLSIDIRVKYIRGYTMDEFKKRVYSTTCKNCGKKVFNAIFCSDKCKHQSYVKHMRSTLFSNRMKMSRLNTCINCKRDFKKKSKDDSTIFCSSSCLIQYKHNIKVKNKQQYLSTIDNILNIKYSK